MTVQPLLYATAYGIAQRTDLRLTPWTHEADDEWSAIITSADDPDEDSAEGDARMILIAVPTAIRWRAAIVAPGGFTQPLAKVVQDTIGRPRYVGWHP